MFCICAYIHHLNAFFPPHTGNYILVLYNILEIVHGIVDA